MSLNEPPFGMAVSAIRRQAPALFVFSCLVNLLLLVSAIYMLQVYDRVLSSGSMDTLLLADGRGPGRDCHLWPVGAGAPADSRANQLLA